jgi:hypothetical protein
MAHLRRGGGPGRPGSRGLGTAGGSPHRRIRESGNAELHLSVGNVVDIMHAANNHVSHAAAGIEAVQERVAPFPCTAIRQYDFRRGWFQFHPILGPGGLAGLCCCAFGPLWVLGRPPRIRGRPSPPGIAQLTCSDSELALSNPSSLGGCTCNNPNLRWPCLNFQSPAASFSR